MKMWNIPDDNIIFLLRNINCHNRIQSILKSHEKKPFQKSRPYELGHIKIELINQDKWFGNDCTLKYLECILLIPALIATART